MGIKSLPVRKASNASTRVCARRQVVRAQAKKNVNAAAAVDMPELVMDQNTPAVTWDNGGDLQPTGEWRRNLDLKVRRCTCD
jgi:hypothetical protein